MSVAAHLDDFTQATPPESAPRCSTPHEPYVSATPGVTKLIFPGPRMQLKTHIAVANRRYLLRGAFIIELREVEPDLFVATHRELPVEGDGSTPVEAIESFCETFDFQWRHLVEVDESALTEGGRRRRRAMQSAVEKVLTRH